MAAGNRLDSGILGVLVSRGFINLRGILVRFELPYFQEVERDTIE